MGKAAIGLTFYAIRIRPYRNTSEYKNLSKLDDGYPTFREAVKKVLKKAPVYEEDGFEIKKCPYGLLKYEEQNGGQIVGAVMCGENGYSANIHDGETGKLMHKQKSTDHAIHPYYFLFDAPDNTDVALVCLQTYGLHAIKGLFLTDMDGFATRFDISEDIKRDGSGHPVFESINEKAKLVLADVAKKVRGKK